MEKERAEAAEAEVADLRAKVAELKTDLAIGRKHERERIINILLNFPYWIGQNAKKEIIDAIMEEMEKE